MVGQKFHQLLSRVPYFKGRIYFYPRLNEGLQRFRETLSHADFNVLNKAAPGTYEGVSGKGHGYENKQSNCSIGTNGELPNIDQGLGKYVVILK